MVSRQKGFLGERNISRDLGISYRASYDPTLEIETIIMPLISQKQVAVSAHIQVN